LFAQIDDEMRKRGLEVVVVYGDSTLGNPGLTYVVGGTVVRGGVFFKRVGQEPILIVGGPDIARAQGYKKVKKVCTYTEFGLEKLVMQYAKRKHKHR
jgi:hypothetical protein